jgi:RNA polymerase-binding transcription factor DksA
MSRQLAQSTIDKFREELLAERARLVAVVEEHERELEESLQSEDSSERIPDPATGEGGTLSFEYEMERQLDAATLAHVQQIDVALGRMDAGTYGDCEDCGNAIPIERLRALPHTTRCVSCASKRR